MPAPRSVRTGRQRHRHRQTGAQLATRRLVAAGALGYAAATLLYLSAFGVSLDGFRSHTGPHPADSGESAAAAANRAVPSQLLARTSSRLVASSDDPVSGSASFHDASSHDGSSGDQVTTEKAGAARAVERAEPPTALELARNASVSTAAGLQAAVPPPETITGPVVGGRVQPPRVLPPKSGAGSYRVAPGHDQARVAPGGQVIRYRVEVERGLPFATEEFAADVHRILNDPRGWGRNSQFGFERVDHGRVQLIVSLSSPRLTDVQCAPLRTLGRVSCWNGHRAVINAVRWGIGAKTYGRDLLSYREYLINHEVGHGLGKGHVNCPHVGWLAPIMVQQTKSLEGCRANPWPHPRAGRR